MQGINRAEFACRLSLPENLRYAAKQWTKVFFHDRLKLARPTPAGTHHFALYNSRVQGMSRDIVEVRAGVGKNFLAGRKIARQYFADTRDESAKHLIEYRTIQSFFILKVVIKESLVHLGGACNGICSGSGNALVGKLTNRGLQNRSPALLRPSARAQA